MFKAGNFFGFLEKVFFFLLILLLPTQFGLHFWPGWSFVAGIRVDYLAPTIYLTDLLIAGLLFCALFNRSRFAGPKNWLVIGVVVLLALVNSVFATNPQASFLKWGKILELALLFLYLVSTDKKQTTSLLVRALPFSILFFATVGFLQIIWQKTVGGPFYFLGERTFSAATPGIALYSLFGRVLLRPYSTFAHPNVFGAYLFAATLSFWFLKRTKTRFDYLVLAVGLGAALLSGSAGVYFGAVGVGLLLFLRESSERFLKFMPLAAILVSFGFLVFSSTLNPQNFPQNVAQRLSLAKAGAAMIYRSPFLGIGVNNFIVNLPPLAAQDSTLWILQPVHNLFLLTFVETGISGLLGLAYLLQKVMVPKNRLVLVIVFVILTGLFDHYWLTLQQPQIFFTLLLGLLW